MADQLDERTQRLIDAAINSYIARHPPPQGPPGPPGPAGPAGIATGNGNGVDRFNPQDVGFFDPFYDGFGGSFNRRYQPQVQPIFQRQPFYQPPLSGWQNRNPPSQFGNYQNNAYQSNYQNRGLQGQPSNAQQQQRLQAPPNRLQLTAGQPNSSGFNNQPARQPFNPVNYSNQQNRAGQFQPKPVQQPAGQFDGGSDAYHQWEPTSGFQDHDAPQEHGYDDQAPGTDEPSNVDTDWDAGADIHFVNPTAPTPSSEFNYQKCSKRFTSRNKLFSHLRGTCWLPKSAGVVEPAQALLTKSTDDKQLRVIKSTVEAVSGNGYAFKNWHYTVVQVYWDQAY
ncbi:MAG: hypothetical protein Q9211_001111 [Gyalolechia sp. 1 TL-2023]